ncbi:neuropeptides capa receptor-like [Asterias amurensis]|uniref:neuropeptides capa receptor-like n=1 Tax=Asterias amurensis TaxID=7602 RepID=UPI003AB19335
MNVSSMSFGKSEYNEYSSLDEPLDQCDLPMNFSESETKIYEYAETDRVINGVLLPVILGLGILSNFAFLYVVYCVKRMRTSTNYCLTNLAIADVLFLLGSVGSKIWKYSQSPISIDDSSLGRAGCIIIYLISDTAFLFSLADITLVSFQKFYAVCSAHRALGDSRRRVFVRLLAASWILAFCIALTFIPCTMDYVVICSSWPSKMPYQNWPNEFAYCGPVKEWTIIYGAGAQAIPFILIFPINVYLYCRIISGITQVIEDTSVTGRRRINIRQRNQIAVMLIVNGVVFFICLAPFEIMSLFYMIGFIRERFILHEDTRNSLISAARIMSYINAAINPFVYTCMSTQYRDAFRQTFGLQRCDQPGSATEQESIFKHLRRLSYNITASTSAGGGLRLYHGVHARSRTDS